MSADHELMQHELAAYVLEGLDPETTERIEQHLRRCPECRQIVREYEAVKDLLPFGLPVAQPSPAGRAALLRQLQAEGTEHRARSSRKWRLRWPWPALRPRIMPVALVVAVIMALAVGFGVWQQPSGNQTASTVQQLRTRPDVQVVSLMGSPSAPAAGGQLLFTPDLSQAAVTVSGLPALPPDRTYQVWFDRADQSWASGGLFRVNQQGDADAVVQFPDALSAYRGCWITEEPAGGSTTPSGSLVLATARP